MTDITHEVDYSALLKRPVITRWSGLAISLYAATSVVLLLFIMLLVAPFAHAVPLWFYLLLSGLLLLQAVAIRSVAHRTDPTRPNDIWRFAEANNFIINSPCNPRELATRVYIRERMSAWLPHYMRWWYAVPLTIRGSYRSLPIAFYNLTVPIDRPTDSTIEQDQRYDDRTRNDHLAPMTLTLPFTPSPGPQRTGVGVVLWQLPNIDTRKLNQIRHHPNVLDAQTDSHELAILLDSNMPYDRDGMMSLFGILDKAYEKQPL